VDDAFDKGAIAVLRVLRRMGLGLLRRNMAYAYCAPALIVLMNLSLNSRRFVQPTRSSELSCI